MSMTRHLLLTALSVSLSTLWAAPAHAGSGPLAAAPPSRPVARPAQGDAPPTPQAPAAPSTGARGARAAAPDANRGAVSTVPTAELLNMLDTYAIVQAQQALDLNDEQYGQFVTRLKRLQEARRRNQRDRNQILQALRRLTSPPLSGTVGEAAIRTRLRALREHDTSATAELRQAADAVDEVLTARQQARFRLFEETMERRKLDLLFRARERAARPGRQ